MTGNVGFVAASTGGSAGGDNAPNERRLSTTPNANATAELDANAGGQMTPPELLALLNTLITCALAIACTCIVYLSIVLCWRHRVNRRYYAAAASSLGSSYEPGGDAEEGGKQPAKAPATFTPFPKSLMWPTPLFFTCCIFVTGLTRSSVKLLAARPSACGAACYAVPVLVLAVLVAVVVAAVVDLRMLQRRHGNMINWKMATRLGRPADVADPWMRLGAKTAVQAKSVQIIAADTQVAKSLRHSVAAASDTKVAKTVRKSVVSVTEANLRVAKSVRGSLKALPVGGQRRQASTCKIEPAMSGTPVEMFVEPIDEEDDEVTPSSSSSKALGDTVKDPPPSPPAQEEGEGAAGPQTIAAPPRSLGRRQSAIAKAAEKLGERGHRDRKSGVFSGLPEEDVAEPERTERILANPWLLLSRRPGQAFQSREGFFMFRVNGKTAVGRYFRILVVLLNMTFGLLSGLSPLLPPGSAEAVAQTVAILTLQFLMAFLCCYFLPDADRIISRFAAIQFLMEGCATTAMLIAVSYVRATGGGDLLDSGTVTLANNMTFTTDDKSAAELLALHSASQDTGFLFALVAMSVPIIQLIEQRCVTPVLGVYISHGGGLKGLAAPLFLLVMSLPKKICSLIGLAETADDGDAAADTNNSASGNAGDDDADDGGGKDKDGGAAKAMGTADSATRVTKLIARAVAAKETVAKSIKTAMAPFRGTTEKPSGEGLAEESGGAGFGGAIAAARLKKKLAAKKEARVAPSDEAEDVDDEDDD